MLEGIKIECWDKEDSHGSIELDFARDDEGDPTILHITMPMLDATQEISCFLDDFELALKRLKVT